MTWDVDDPKVSHVDPKEVTRFCLTLSKIYGKGLIVTGGKVYTYLGMDVDYSTNTEVKVSMIRYAE